MPGQAAREKEIQYRLLNVIDILEEEHLDCPPLPDEAAEQWTEAEIRAFFRSGGDARPGPVPPTVIQGLPGGTSYDHVGNDSWNHGPDAYHHGLKHNATVEAYQSCALQEGIPDRPHGLFPPNDPYLTSLAKTRGLSPFQKCQIGGSGEFEICKESWAAGEGGARKGIDFRYFFDVNTADSKERGGGGRLVGAVRFNEDASIGKGFWTTAHGGAMETVLDEATAEVCKISQAASAVTIEARFTMKKGVPLHTTLMVEATVTGVVSDGLRVNTEGAIKSVDGKTVYCTCKAQLVDFGGVRRITNTNHNMLDHKGSNSSLSSLG